MWVFFLSVGSDVQLLFSVGGVIHDTASLVLCQVAQRARESIYVDGNK